MVCTVDHIAQWMSQWAPEDTAEPRDHVGLQVGCRQDPVSVVVVALDVTSDAIEYARHIGAQLLVTHHPLLYRPLTSITGESPVGSLALQAIRAGVALYAAHTNLDLAPGGVNDALCAKLGFIGGPAQAAPMARLVQLAQPVSLQAFAVRVRDSLGAPAVRLSGAEDRLIHRVYVLGGAGRHDIDFAVQSDCDVILTGELDYHAALTAGQLGLATIEAGHDFTERPVLEEMKTYLQKQAKALQYTLRTEVYLPACCPFWYV